MLYFLKPDINMFVIKAYTEMKVFPVNFVMQR